MIDFTTNYLGLNLKHPIIASASPLSQKIDGVRRLEDAGVAAVVLHSLFEEQLTHEAFELHAATMQGTESFAEATSYFPEPDNYLLGPEEYLKLISKAKDMVGIPIIASLNGMTPGGWVKYARSMQEAGADALELNIYFMATNPSMTGQEVEDNYFQVLREVRSQIKIPIALKLSPFFSNLSYMAQRFDEEGVDALVLFNRFYQPDLDIENLEVLPQVNLSTSLEIRLPLRWIAILYGHVRCNLAATTGVHSATDVFKMIMAGADAVQMCSALFQHGLSHVNNVLADMKDWMIEHEYDSIALMKGSLCQKSVADPSAYERANYMKTLQSFRPTI